VIRGDKCALCGRPDPFGLNLCSECGASNDAADALVFVRGTPDRGGPREAESRLASLIGDAAIRRAARGKQALLRLPSTLAPRVVERLETAGVGARVVPIAQAWTAMPAHFFVMLLAILSFGTVAGLDPLPSMLWTSPLLAFVLLLVAHHSMTRPALGNARHAPRLPGPAAQAVRRAFAQLTDDLPRGRLAGVVRVAQPVLAGAPRSLGKLLSELVVAACATALETERQTAVLAVLEERTDAPDLAAAAKRCEHSRRVGLELLERAETAVARLGASHALQEAEGEQRPLADLVRELEQEAEAQAEAVRDLESLLGG
jgi:hypothetical protein